MKPELKPRMPVTLAVNMDIVRAGRTCALKKTLERAVSEGDKRTLSLLRAVRLEAKPVGNKKDPFACLRDDLPKAIAKLQDKSK